MSDSEEAGKPTGRFYLRVRMLSGVEHVSVSTDWDVTEAVKVEDMIQGLFRPSTTCMSVQSEAGVPTFLRASQIESIQLFTIEEDGV